MKKILYIIVFLIISLFLSNMRVFSLEKINLKINNSNNNISLSWENDESASLYKIYRSDKKNGKYKNIISTKENNYVNKKLKYGKTYYYKVISYDQNSSITSNIVSKKVIPNKVDNLRIINVDKNNIKIGWNKNSVSGYEIYRSTNNKKWSRIKTISKNSTITFNDKKLKTNKTYYYKLRSYVKVNGRKVYSLYSNVINAKTLTSIQKNAIKDVSEYLKKLRYSKEELLSKLNYDNNTKEFAIKYLNIDFNINAVDCVNIYMKLFNMTQDELKIQLKTYDKFKDEEIYNAIMKYNGEYGDGIASLEYKYKKDLYLLGYSNDEIDKIIESFSLNEINKYLMNSKYKNLFDFKQSLYFNIKNIKRYQSYFDKNKYTALDAVMYVEIGLDYDFYTNMKKANVNDGKLMLINKYNYHDKNYNANLEKLGSGYGNGSLNKEAAKNFRKMVDAAKKDGIKLWSVSAYRSYTTQKNIYNRYVKKDGVKKADTYSARPGHSEHSTGLAVDINTASSKTHFENKKEYKWLKENSYKYGFIERYMKGKEFITGYKYEPWHFRYFGEEVATKLYELNVTYEEYLIIKNNLQE